jgi:hypothetical protein
MATQNNINEDTSVQLDDDSQSTATPTKETNIFHPKHENRKERRDRQFHRGKYRKIN